MTSPSPRPMVEQYRARGEALGGDAGHSPWADTYDEARTLGEARLRAGSWARFEIEKSWTLARPA